MMGVLMTYWQVDHLLEREVRQIALPEQVESLTMNHTNERIKKLLAKGMTPEQIVKKIGRPNDVDRVLKVVRLMATLDVIRVELDKTKE